MGVIKDFFTSPSPLASAANFHDSSLQSMILNTELQQLSLSVAQGLNVASIFRARQMTADVIASVPVRIGDDLAPPPNDEQSMQDFLTESVLSMADAGDAYWFKDGQNLRVLPHSEVSVVWDAPSTGTRLRRRVTRWGNRRLRTTGITRNAWTVAMNRGAGDTTGRGPMQSARIQGVLAAQAYAEQYFLNNANPTGILKVSGPMTPEEATKLKKQWIDNQATRTPAVLSSNYDFEPTGFNPSDSEWVGTHRMGTGDVALLFGLQGSQLDYNTPGSSITYQSLGDINESWWKSALFPYYARRFEVALTEFYGSQVVFDPELLFLANLDVRARSAAKLVNAGYDPADAADVSGLPPMQHSGVLPKTVQQEQTP